MSDEKLTAIVAVCAVMALAIIWGMGYTKAQNDQEFYRIIGSEMSEEGFENWMMPEVSRAHTASQA